MSNTNSYQSLFGYVNPVNSLQQQLDKIPVLPLNTKGDLVTYSTHPTKLSVGINDQVLTSDSSTDTGLKWNNSLKNISMDGSINTFTNIDHTTALTNVGTNTHAQIDTHIGSSSAHGVSGSIVGTSDSQTLTNKTISASNNTITNINHTTLTNIGTNTHAQIDSHISSYNAHGTSGAVVGTSDVQTLLSKTINSASNTIQVSGTNINNLINQDVRSTASPSFIKITTTDTTNPEITMSASTKNRKIVLYPGFNNDHQFYGIGVNNSILRFQLDQTTTNAIFYAGTSSTTSNEVFRILGSGGINFTGNTTSGYTPSALNYYEEATLATTATNVNFTVNVNIRITRIGNTVRLHIDNFAGTLSSAGAIGTAASLATRFCPVNNTKFVVVVIDNSNSRIGILSIASNGSIAVFSTGTTGLQTGFTTGTCGIDSPTSICYSIS